MYHIGKASGLWHMKGINMNLAKECTRHGNYGQYVNLMEVSDLTDMARVCIPFDIHAQIRPPEMFNKMCAHSIHTMVTYLIMCLS